MARAHVTRIPILTQDSSVINRHWAVYPYDRELAEQVGDPLLGYVSAPNLSLAQMLASENFPVATGVTAVECRDTVCNFQPASTYKFCLPRRKLEEEPLIWVNTDAPQNLALFAWGKPSKQ